MTGVSTICCGAQHNAYTTHCCYAAEMDTLVTNKCQHLPVDKVPLNPHAYPFPSVQYQDVKFDRPETKSREAGA